MPLIDWVVKVSKLCNLRCRYCYEWENLANPARMSLDTWASLVAVAHEFHRAAAERCAPEPFQTRFVWHGGEPLLLPRAYFDEVLALQAAAFGADAIAQRHVRNAAQTNLYAPNFSLIQHLHDRGFTFGVSHDFVPGLRRTASGADSCTRVMRNVERVHALGIRNGFIVVLASHTVPHVEDIYRQARALGCRIRFLPLADGNGAPDMPEHACTRAEMVDALMRVFSLWFADGCPFSIDPLDECLRVVTMKWLALDQPEFDRERGLDSVLVVEPDGALRQICELTDACDVLGNVRHQSWEEIRASRAYQESVLRDRRVRSTTCEGCAHRRACDGQPALRFNQAAARRGECGVFRPLVARVEAELEALGVSRIDMRALLAEWASPAHSCR